MIVPVRKIGPTFEVITTAEAKEHLRIDGSTEDSYLDGLIATSGDYIESRTGSIFRGSTWEYCLPCFPKADAIRVHLGNIKSLSGLSYADPQGTPQTYTDAQVELERLSARIWPAVGSMWPTTQSDNVRAVCLTIMAGEEAPEDIPANIKHAAKLLIGDWYERRENLVTGTIIGKIPTGVDSLLSSYLRVGV